MFSVPELLDRAKRGAGVETDYALAKALGHARQANVSNWRNEKVLPDDQAIIDLCRLSGDDPAYVAAELQAMRAASAEARTLWEQIAERLSHPTTAKIAVALAIVFAAQMLGGTDSFATIGLAAALDGFSTHRIELAFGLVLALIFIGTGAARRIARALRHVKPSPNGPAENLQ